MRSFLYWVRRVLEHCGCWTKVLDNEEVDFVRRGFGRYQLSYHRRIALADRSEKIGLESLTFYLIFLRSGDPHLCNRNHGRGGVVIRDCMFLEQGYWVS